MKKEVWRYIPGYEGLYQVSNWGRVKSLDRVDGQNHIIKGKIKTLERAKNGYLRVSLFLNGKGKKFLVHRLVAAVFIPNIENKEMVNHKNCKRDDNRVENLEWVSGKENQNHPLSITNKSASAKQAWQDQEVIEKHREGCKRAAEKIKIPVAQYTKDGQFIKIWPSAKDAERSFGKKDTHIGDCCKGKACHSSCLGFVWKYA